MFMRFLGQALGAAVAGVILSFGLHDRVPEVADPLGRLLDLHGLTGPARASLAASVSDAFHGIFGITALMGLAALGLALQLPRGVSAGSSGQATPQRSPGR
jgi:hypothetical protein